MELQLAQLLQRQLAELNKNSVDNSDLYRWEVLIFDPPDTLYVGGDLKAHLTFPKDYPHGLLQ